MSRYRMSVLVVAAAITAPALIHGPAKAQTWTGATNSDWNTAGNWSPASVPNSATAVANFDDTAQNSGVTLSQNVTTQAINFSNSVLAYTIGSAMNSTPTLTTAAITLVAGSVSPYTAKFSLASVNGGNLIVLPQAGQPVSYLTITNNTGSFQYFGGFSVSRGGLTFDTSTVLASGMPPANGKSGIIVGGIGYTAYNGSFSPINPVNGGLTKTGQGVFDFAANGSNLSGGLTLNGGTLNLDYSNTGQSLLSGGALTLAGGVLAATGSTSSQANDSVSGGTFITAGHTDVVGFVVQSNPLAVTISLGSITRSVSATADFAASTGGTPPLMLNTTTATTNGLLGNGPAFATVNGGSDWATVSSGAIAAFTNYAPDTYTPGSNTDVTMSATQSSITTNSLRFNTYSASSLTLTLSGTNTLQSGGILVTPSSGSAMISGGTLASPTGELIVHQYAPSGYLASVGGPVGLYPSQEFVINSAIAAPAGLTKTGPGVLALGGNNTGLTGPININRGSLTVTNLAAINSASRLNFNDNSGSPLAYTSFSSQVFAVDLGNNVNGTVALPITLSAYAPGDYGTYFSNGSSTGARITLSGVISSAPGLTTPIRFAGGGYVSSGYVPSPASGFNLTNANTFTGDVSLLAGYLGITSNANLGKPSNTLYLEDVNGGTDGGLVFLNSGVNLARPVVVNSTTRIVSNGTDSNTISGPIEGGTFNGSFTGGDLIKGGTGTLALTGQNSGFIGTITLAAGTLAIPNDSALGPGGVTMTPFGTLAYTSTTTTTMSFPLNNSNLGVYAGQTVTFNGSQVSGGYLNGPGTFATDPTNGAQFASITTRPGVTLVSKCASDFFSNITNGGTFNVAAGLPGPVLLSGFTNEGSGAITVGAHSQLNVEAFQTYGTLTLNPAVVGSGQFTELVNTGSSPLYFNGGSRTFLGTPATANSGGNPTFVAGIDLHGNNAVIAGGLFVNNGFVVDLSTGGTPGSVIVDYGALYKGAGYTGVNLITQNGGKVQAGNSPGSASFGRFVFGPGGVSNYVFAIDDATGTAGPSPDVLGHVSGWGLVKAIQQTFGSMTSSGDLTWTATPNARLTVAIDTLVNPTTVGTDVAGAMADFDPMRAYSWLAARWAGTYSGPMDAVALDAATSFDTSGFLNATAGTFGWSLDPAGQTLSLVYAPSSVPEPGTLALTTLGCLGLGWVARRRVFLAGGRTKRLPTQTPASDWHDAGVSA